jgi:hypothetical protein
MHNNKIKLRPQKQIGENTMPSKFAKSTKIFFDEPEQKSRAKNLYYVWLFKTSKIVG